MTNQMNMLTLCVEDRPANPSPSLESGLDSMIRAATSASSIFDWLRDAVPAGSFSKMSPAFSRLTGAETSEPCSTPWQSAGIMSAGECLTLSISDWPSDGSASSLSDILEDGPVPQRYCLSAKACEGILRRAEKRGKTVPPMLEAALRSVAESPQGGGQRLDLETETFVVGTVSTILAGGNGTGGDRPPGTTVDTMDSLVAAIDLRHMTLSDTASTMQSGGIGKDRGGNPELVPHCFAIQERAVSGSEAGPDGAGFKADVAYTIEARSNVQAVAWSRDTASALTSNYAKQPDNSDTAQGPNLVAFGISQSCDISKSTDPVGTLCKDSPTGGGSPLPAVAFMENQRAELRVSDQTDAMSCSGGKPGQGYPAALHGATVRRLTPRECERLQGFPDDYTQVPWRGKPMADGPRYRMLGNSWAVPVFRWLFNRIDLVDRLLREGRHP